MNHTVLPEGITLALPNEPYCISWRDLALPNEPYCISWRDLALLNEPYCISWRDLILPNEPYCISWRDLILPNELYCISWRDLSLPNEPYCISWRDRSGSTPWTVLYVLKGSCPTQWTILYFFKGSILFYPMKCTVFPEGIDLSLPNEPYCIISFKRSCSTQYTTVFHLPLSSQPQVTKLLFTNCPAMASQVKEKFSSRPKYR